jgi:adenylate cyclase, class 2
MREVEIKFNVADVGALRKQLRSMGFKLKTRRTHEFNTLYDLPDGSLRQRGEILRLRKYGEEWKLTHKAKSSAGLHKSREETETLVEDGEQMEKIIEALGYRPSFRYEKFREEWSSGKGDVVVDETPIGNIAEIEGTPRWIDQTAKKLGIEKSGYSTKSYAELFFEWKQKTGSRAEEMTWKAIGRRKR